MKKEKNKDFIFIIVLLLIVVLLAVGLTKAILTIGQFAKTEVETDNIEQYADMQFEGEEYLAEIGQNSEQIAKSIEILESCGIHSITYIRDSHYEPFDYPNGTSYYFTSGAPVVQELNMEVDENRDLQKLSGGGYLFYYDNETITDIEPLVITEKEIKRANKRVIKETEKQYPNSTVEINTTDIKPYFVRTKPNRNYYKSRGLVNITDENGNLKKASFEIEFDVNGMVDFSLNEY